MAQGWEAESKEETPTATMLEDGRGVRLLAATELTAKGQRGD